jgi:hypothetical protein
MCKSLHVSTIQTYSEGRNQHNLILQNKYRTYNLNDICYSPLRCLHSHVCNDIINIVNINPLLSYLPCIIWYGAFMFPSCRCVLVHVRQLSHHDNICTKSRMPLETIPSFYILIFNLQYHILMVDPSCYLRAKMCPVANNCWRICRYRP